MIAAVRRRIGKAFSALSAAPIKWSRRADRSFNRGLERVHPALQRNGRRLRAAAAASLAWAGPRLRPPAALFFRGLALGEAAVRKVAALGARAATALSRVITPRRALGIAIAGAGIALVVSQFIDYRAVEIGQPGYANLPGGAKPPTIDPKTAGQAHAYLLVPIGGLAAVMGLLAARGARPRLGLSIAVLGLLAVAVILLVDLPHGLDAGNQTSRFAGASAVLEDGFYAELAAAAGLVLCGLLYYARPCLIRINSSGRAASARRRRPRPPASSPGRVARSAYPLRSGAASAPVSQR
jgi:hypothetical protein